MLCDCGGALWGAGRGAGTRPTEGRFLTGRRAEMRAIGLAISCFFATGFLAAGFLTPSFFGVAPFFGVAVFFAATFFFAAGLAARLAFAVIGFLRFAMSIPSRLCGRYHLTKRRVHSSLISSSFSSSA